MGDAPPEVFDFAHAEPGGFASPRKGLGRVEVDVVAGPAHGWLQPVGEAPPGGAFIRGAEDAEPTRPQNPPDLLEGGKGIGDVLQDVVEEDEVEGFVGG